MGKLQNESFINNYEALQEELEAEQGETMDNEINELKQKYTQNLNQLK